MSQVVKGSDIIYSLVAIKKDDIPLIKDSRHEVCGYILFEDEYKFFSVEDKYTNPILNHWTFDIVKNYDNETCWLLIKQHPCNLYSIITEMYKGNYVCNVHNFDIWTSKTLVAVVTDIEID
jgi:hypothetical protein